MILLDLMMPGMDGVDFRARQQADPALRGIPVVIISARPDVARQAERLHADAFLQKPMSFEELLHVVQNRAITEVGAPEFESSRPTSTSSSAGSTGLAMCTWKPASRARAPSSAVA